MKLEKRGDLTPQEETPRDETPQEEQSRKKPVVVYIMILFVVAFLLMALSFMMHQRTNSQVLGELQDSVSAMQEIQASQDRLLELQQQLQDTEEEMEDLTEELAQAQEEMDQSQRRQDALLALYALQQQYAAGDLTACAATLQRMSDESLVDLLPEEGPDGVTSPAERYQQLKEAVLNS